MELIKLISVLNLTFYSSQTVSDCINNPTDDKCVDFKIKDDAINQSLDSLCSQMPNMPGCTIRSLCKKDDSSQQCNSFSILGDICSKDMPNMSDCQDYTNMCKEGTKVKQCTQNKPIKNLPKTQETMKLVESICSDMNMSGCQKCKDDSNCDLLKVYSELCLSMPDMKQCSVHKELCREVSEFSICKNVDKNNNQTPVMRMYFHTGLADYILFKGWVPHTGAQYFGSFLVIVLLGIIYELIGTIRSRLEQNWSQKDISVPCKYSFLQFKTDTLRGCLRMVEILISYLLMLIAMTYNVGLFFAVVIGFGLGTFLFGRLSSHNPNLKMGCGC